MGRIRNTLAVAAVGAALAAPGASAAEAPPPLPTTSASTPPQPAAAAPESAIQKGATLTPPTPAPAATPSTGGVSADGAKGKQETTTAPEAEAPAETGVETAPALAESFPIPSIPTSTCASTGVPPVLVPIYQRAADAYALGPQGPSVLAGINEVETAFGTNLNISSAGAEGWMQFMPETWSGYGVDANGDGVKDPFNPEDAIYAAAAYLSANGMPQDTYGAIFAYNHADWYVAEVLSNAACYAPEVGGAAITEASLAPQHKVLACKTNSDSKGAVPAPYMEAFENAAARYDLGQRGVWALAAIGRLESNFGAGLNNKEMRQSGALGLEPSEWKHFGVDGDEDGKIRHGDPADAAATLARLIWSSGSLRAGIFSHNHAEWYVQEVLDQAEAMEGNCKVTYAAWSYAPLGGLGPGPSGATSILVDGLANAPQDAPPAVKAAVNAANSISTTPYIWGGGHGSWYSSGYDCSGAVSFALYGGGLLDTPMTSGSLMSYGEPGPGRWITIYASPTHTYAEIAGLRWDTVGDAEGTGPRWHVEPPYPEGFVVRHPVGY